MSLQKTELGNLLFPGPGQVPGFLLLSVISVEVSPGEVNIIDRKGHYLNMSPVYPDMRHMMFDSVFASWGIRLIKELKSMPMKAIQFRHYLLAAIVILLIAGRLESQDIEPPFRVGSDWERAAEKDDFVISKRDVYFNNTETRQTSIEGMFDAPVQYFEELMTGTSRIWECLKQTESIRDFDISPDRRNWCSHIIYEMPWPVKKQDLVVSCHIQPENDLAGFTVVSTGVPDMLPTLHRVNRLEAYRGEWIFAPVNDGSTRVT